MKGIIEFEDNKGNWVPSSAGGADSVEEAQCTLNNTPGLARDSRYRFRVFETIYSLCNPTDADDTADLVAKTRLDSLEDRVRQLERAVFKGD